MSTSFFWVLAIAVFSAGTKGMHLRTAIKQKNKDKIKVELFFFLLILCLAAALLYSSW